MATVWHKNGHHSGNIDVGRTKGEVSWLGRWRNATNSRSIRPATAEDAVQWRMGNRQPQEPGHQESRQRATAAETAAETLASQGLAVPMPSPMTMEPATDQAENASAHGAFLFQPDVGPILEQIDAEQRGDQYLQGYKAVPSPTNEGICCAVRSDSPRTMFHLNSRGRMIMMVCVAMQSGVFSKDTGVVVMRVLFG